MSDNTWIEYENELLNKGNSKITIKRDLSFYESIKRNLGVPLKKATRKDIEAYVNALNRDEIRKVNGDKFSGSTKKKLKTFLKAYFKWFKGDNEFYPPEVNWISTRIRKDEKPKARPTIDIEQAKRIAYRFRKVEQRVLFLLLVDSGFRISEMLSVRKKDITYASFDDDGNQCFWVNCPSSKTYGRNVEVPLFTADIEAFFNSSAYASKKEDELIFDISYDSFLKSMKAHSKAEIGVSLTPHCLRHSSATLYADYYQGDNILLAKRYGWRFSSAQLDTYIRRSTSNTKKGAQLIHSSKVRELEKENHKLREEFESFKSDIHKFLNNTVKRYQKGAEEFITEPEKLKEWREMFKT